MDIKEIVLQLAHRKCTRYNHVPVDRGIRYNFSDAHLIDLAEALIAELAKQNEPVASVVPCHTPSGKMVALNTEYQHLPVGTKLYTIPPTAEQIANETAGACR